MMEGDWFADLLFAESYGACQEGCLRSGHSATDDCIRRAAWLAGWNAADTEDPDARPAADLLAV